MSDFPSVGLSDFVVRSVLVSVIISDFVGVTLSFMIDLVADSDRVIDCSTVSVTEKSSNASNVFDSEGVTVTVCENVFENSSLNDAVVVASLDCD